MKNPCFGNSDIVYAILKFLVLGCTYKMVSKCEQFPLSKAYKHLLRYYIDAVEPLAPKKIKAPKSYILGADMQNETI